MIRYLSTIVPANDGILIAFDSMRASSNWTSRAVLTGDVQLIPLADRKKTEYFGWGIQGTIKSTGQVVTARLMGRTLQDLAAADYEEEKSQVTVAGVALGIDWAPFSNHFMLRIDCGVTAPTKLVVDLRLVSPVGR